MLYLDLRSYRSSCLNSSTALGPALSCRDLIYIPHEKNLQWNVRFFVSLCPCSEMKFVNKTLGSSSFYQIAAVVTGRMDRLDMSTCGWERVRENFCCWDAPVFRNKHRIGTDLQQSSPPTPFFRREMIIIKWLFWLLNHQETFQMRSIYTYERIRQWPVTNIGGWPLVNES